MTGNHSKTNIRATKAIFCLLGKLPNPHRTLPAASGCASVPDALTAVPAKGKAGVNHHPGFKKHLLVLAASTLFVVLVYTLFQSALSGALHRTELIASLTTS